LVVAIFQDVRFESDEIQNSLAVSKGTDLLAPPVSSDRSSPFKLRLPTPGNLFKPESINDRVPFHFRDVPL